MTQNEKGTATPTVSIGMPVYNGEKYIREALDSVLAQTYRDFEVIISDNASNDGTQAICVDYSKRDPRIKYIRQDQSQGIYWNFNFVVQKATGSLFTWLAHDDALLPEYLEKTVDYLRHTPGAIIVACDFEVVDESGIILRIEELSGIRDKISWKTRCARFFEYPPSNGFFSIYGLMRTETCKLTVRSLPKFDSTWEVDLKIMCRFAAVGEIASIPVVLRRYRMHALSENVSTVAGHASQPLLQRVVTKAARRYKTRSDQLGVLFSSQLPLQLKYSILLKVIFGYMSFFLTQQIALPSRLINIFVTANKSREVGQ